ncbi:MAG: helix-turn-helix transcriptional regulator [Candidatus Sericytochromatia bacterium]|nr:helix-turn-helix transcriptional regulator [Candidatus Sericytochromatia bacterium]
MSRLRKKQGLTMSALAQAVNVSESYISLLESGERKQPSQELVLKLASVLGARNNHSLTDDFLETAGYYPVNLHGYSSHSEILKTYQAQYEKDPSDFKHFLALIFCLIKKGEREGAHAMIQQGLNQFKQPGQLQSLHASQALLQQKFTEALKLQTAVIEHENGSGLRSDEGQKMGQFHFGIMHFFYGLQLQMQWRKALTYKQSERCLNAQKDAIHHFSKARELFFLLLEKDREDISLLDELAPVCFHLAQIYPEDSADSQQLWQEAIQSQQAVLHSEQKYCLGSEALLERSLSLAHAYAKTKEFTQAENILNILEFASKVPNVRIYYAKCIFFANRHSFSQDEKDLYLALQFLHKAYLVDANLVRQVALYDPDLRSLRADKTMAFRRIFL